MIGQTLRRLCESPRRWLIVTAGTFVVGLVMIVPLVDVYCAERNEKKALLAQVGAATRLTEKIERYESRVGERVAELEALESRAVGEQQLPALRDRLVELARQTGCSLRRLNVGEPMQRPWNPDEMPTDQKTSTLGRKQQVTGFELQWRPISISVSGKVAELRTFLEKVKADDMLVYTKGFEIYPSSAARKTLTMDMDLWYFALASEDIALQDKS
jgi:hypothetical protein